MLCCRSIAAQTPAGQDIVDGYVSAMVDVMPDVSPAEGRQSVSELRARVFVDRQLDIGAHLHLSLSGFVDGLVAARGLPGPSGLPNMDRRQRTAAVARPTDLYAEIRFAHADLRAGASRIVWGRLDEFQPSDVVNPIDLSRFVFEGRSEARMAVGLVRARGFLPHGVTLEGVAVPWFRRGRFDQLDEATSPFNVGSPETASCPPGPPGCPVLLPVNHEPAPAWSSLQGGARVTGTIGRVDLGGSVYRGFEAFPIYTLGPPLPTFAPGPPLFNLFQDFPRFTMVAGDFETVHGPWGVRGEAAYFPEDTLQSMAPLTGVPGRSLDVGVGADRRAGSYRIGANVVASRRRADRGESKRNPLAFDDLIETTDVLIVGSAERSFDRETRVLRLLAAYDPNADSAFVRGIAAIGLRDNVWIELSGGWLNGAGVDILSRLSMRDFVYARIKVHF